MSNLIDWLYRSRAAVVAIVVLTALLAGCTHNQHRADAERAFYQTTPAETPRSGATKLGVIALTTVP